MNDKAQRFSFRKVSFGLASVLVGLFFLGGSPVSADETISSNIPTEVVTNQTYDVTPDLSVTTVEDDHVTLDLAQNIESQDVAPDSSTTIVEDEITNTSTETIQDVESPSVEVSNNTSDKSLMSESLVAPSSTATNAQVDENYSKTTQEMVDEAYKSADTYVNQTPYSIDESASLPSDKIILKEDELTRDGVDYYPTNWNENTKTVREKAQYSGGVVGVNGKIVGTVNSVGFGEVNAMNLDASARVIKHASTMQEIARGNFATSYDFVTDENKAIEARSVTTSYLYADFKAAYERYKKDYALINNPTDEQIASYADVKALYDAYTRKYNLWMGVDSPVEVTYKDGTENMEGVPELVAELETLIKQIPAEYQQYLGSLVIYNQNTTVLGYTYSVDGRVYLNAKYFKARSAEFELNVLLHEIGHIVDGASFYKTTSFSRSSNFDKTSTHYSGNDIENFANAMAGYYMHVMGKKGEVSGNALKATISYVEEYVKPYLTMNNVARYKVDNVYIGATNADSLKDKETERLKEKEEVKQETTSQRATMSNDKITIKTANRTETQGVIRNIKTYLANLKGKKFTMEGLLKYLNGN